jgi:hypothetical protein
MIKIKFKMVMETLPYIQEIIDDVKIRTFDENVDDEELKWHRDREDRIVEVMECNYWYLQMDNELPKPLIVGEKYFIPEGVYHRVIKGVGNLKVKIKKG